ncbi:merR regulatory family protein, partial [Vibrio parahaemolyticus VPTS-2010]
HRY